MSIGKVRRMAYLLALALAGHSAVAQTKPAPTPPMGWNSWDTYGLTITGEQFRANARIEADSLKKFGWTYAVIDEGWFLKNPEDRPHPGTLIYTVDANGRYVPVPASFPSCGKEPAELSLSSRSAAEGSA
jgi:alpha-galactosidase